MQTQKFTYYLITLYLAKQTKMLPSIVTALIDSAHTENSLEISYLLNTKLNFQDRPLEVLCNITNEEKGIIFLVVTEDHEKE